jgi:hypothetical protein
MSELSTLIRRVTDDLHHIQSTLVEAAHPDSAGEFREKVMQELVDVNIVDELKSAVDHMRHLLWSYIDASAEPGSNVSESLQKIRMQRVTEMLRVLQPSVEERSVVQTPVAESFFQLIHEIANSAVERHGDHRSANP